MKFQPGFTDFFMSPVTGRIILSSMPDLYQNYVWIGDRNDRPLPSPLLIDLRLEIVDLRRRLSETRFILQSESRDFDSSQALDELIPGILKHNEGVVSIALPWVDYIPVDLPHMNIWIGDEDNVPQPYPRIFLQNLPSMASSDPLKLLGAYNLYSGSSNPLSLGEPEIVKTLNITNMADLEVGHLWLGTNSLDPFNFGSNRPVPIIVLPLDNMADLPHEKIWRGNTSDRPEPSDALTDLEEEVQDINEEIDNINEEINNINEQINNINEQIGDIVNNITDILETISTITDAINAINDLITNLTNALNALTDLVTAIQGDISAINSQIATINSQISTINSQITDINVQLGDLVLRLDGIDIRLDGIDIGMADLQAQIDAGIESGLDHLADLQAQIDAGIASGLEHLDDINDQFAAVNTSITNIQNDIIDINTTLTSIQGDITTINTTLVDLQDQITLITTTTIPDIYEYVDVQIGDTITNLTNYIDASVENITNNFVAGGVINMNNNRITDLPCDPVEDNDAVSFCFLWHLIHDEVTVTWS